MSRCRGRVVEPDRQCGAHRQERTDQRVAASSAVRPTASRDRHATACRAITPACGAVLVAKLSTGEMAFGDQWANGRTNNPWNPAQGSSGSSAGSAAATAAGLVGFAIGSDTGGSILSPAVRCGVVGLRPTFGRVSRNGVMAAGTTLDKIGPLCRTVEDCGVVLSVIAGPDGEDLAVRRECRCAGMARTATTRDVLATCRR